ncbi:MAG: hypothetical protein WCK32_10240, partial [Chlorobiaceae bacterium]
MAWCIQGLGSSTKLHASYRCNARYAVCKAFFGKKIAAVLYGEGGSGKSTLLRQIALDRAKKGYICWWVENMDSFINHDASSISENSHLRHLVFVEDWYRNMKDNSGTAFFTWLKDQRNVLVLIGDRSFQSSVYGSYCYNGSQYQLLPSENRVVLEHIATASQEYRTMLNEMGELKSLLDKAPLFMILFVAATLLKDRDKHTDIDLNDGVLTAFQKIIANKILVLEKDEHHHGLGKAIYLLAKIYASEKMSYTLFPEDFFLKTASIMGENEYLVERIEMEGYPDEVNALISKKTVSLKKNVDLNVIQFNHDVIAEQGIVYANFHKKELSKALSFDKYGLKKLFDAIAVNTSPIGVIMLWLWLHTEWELAMGENAIEQLLKVLQIGAPNVTGGVFNAILLALPTQDLRKRVCQFILEQQDYYTLQPGIVSTALINAGTKEAKKAAETILSQTDFLTLPQGIVSTALKKANAETATTAAETILSQTNFFTLPQGIVSAALKKANAETATTA